MASRFGRSSSSARRVSAIFTGRRDQGRNFYKELALAGGGDFVTHRGRMMESVLLSVLEASALARARRNLNSQGLN